MEFKTGVRAFPLIVPVAAEVAAHFQFVLDCEDLILGDWVLDWVDAHFGEEAVVQELALRIIGASVNARQDRISNALNSQHSRL